MGRVVAVVAAAGLVVAACGGTDTTALTGSPGPEPTPTSVVPTPDPADPRAALRVDARAVSASWATDWSLSTVDLGEFAAAIYGDDPRDRIAPIDEPVFETVAEAFEWLAPASPGAVVRVGEDVRFYPLAMLIRHEIVNDRFGDTPVAVTYCPLCNTAVAFERRLDGRDLRFGVSGLLRKSDLVMWDDQTESLWQQVTGDAIVGSFAGRRLPVLSTAIVSLEQFAADHPDAPSLSRQTGYRNEYGGNPYPGYSSQSGPAIQFYADHVDQRLDPMDRVVGVSLDGEDVAYPFELVAEEGVINDRVGARPVAVFWAGGTLDALDHYRMTDSQAIGSAVAFERTVGGRILTFEANLDGRFTDVETGSTWTILGVAVDGELAGERLQVAPHRNEFWFAFAAFFPDGRLVDAT
ncbi:MAG: DUF3179 domain-containing protein [Actinomycetota bacterium]